MATAPDYSDLFDLIEHLEPEQVEEVRRHVLRLVKDTAEPDETEYLLSSPENARRLLASRQAAAEGRFEYRSLVDPE
ncbi:type II toxin-antitoxin system prevent-host-death family antitoxin [Kitasatospora sp. NPDC093806]|uniref:type II toxin-antitoxin system prevent-host-death family antitoxin n=1 Tax=Kitasatospora sp. NPDC093806 TaxID=3155075 RepID=UPI00343B4F04